MKDFLRNRTIVLMVGVAIAVGALWGVRSARVPNLAVRVGTPVAVPTPAPIAEVAVGPFDGPVAPDMGGQAASGDKIVGVVVDGYYVYRYDWGSDRLISTGVMETWGVEYARPTTEECWESLRNGRDLWLSTPEGGSAGPDGDTVPEVVRVNAAIQEADRRREKEEAGR